MKDYTTLKASTKTIQSLQQQIFREFIITQLTLESRLLKRYFTKEAFSRRKYSNNAKWTRLTKEAREYKTSNQERQ